ncbi:glutamate receptor-like [Amphibalanus amphitrite]|uniref:glutamate receptor-like n=1 Tax=Amphibalanus amphitrite TaxID=1232801 RepID=UPI001C90F283|nr:glutamate receptor-like [Amphibalanus amphitrite]
MARCAGLVSMGPSWASVEPNTAVPKDEELRISAFHDPPYFFITHHENGSHTYDGYLYQLWQMLACMVDLRYRIIPLTGGGYGRLSGNRTWTGVTGELTYGRADLALSWLGMTSNRTAVIDFLDVIPVSWYQDDFYVRSGPVTAPELRAKTFASLLRPLHEDVWWMLLGSLLVISVLLHVTVRVGRGISESELVAGQMSWGSCLLNTLRSVVGQGWDTMPDSLAARTVTLSSWILGMLLYASYTAKLMCHLTVPTPSRPLHSLHEFAAERDWIIAMEPGVSILDGWKVSDKPHERQIFQRVENGDRYIELYPTHDNKSGFNIDRVLFHADFRRLRYAIGQESCKLVRLLDTPPNPPIRAYMPIAKGRPALRDKLNRAMLELAETGLVDRIRNRWMTQLQRDCDAPTANYRPLSLTNLLAMLLIVPLAVVASVMLLALEQLYGRTGNWRRQQLVRLRERVSAQCDRYLTRRLKDETSLDGSRSNDVGTEKSLHPYHSISLNGEKAFGNGDAKKTITKNLA